MQENAGKINIFIFLEYTCIGTVRKSKYAIQMINPAQEAEKNFHNHWIRKLVA